MNPLEHKPSISKNRQVQDIMAWFHKEMTKISECPEKKNKAEVNLFSIVLSRGCLHFVTKA